MPEVGLEAVLSTIERLNRQLNRLPPAERHGAYEIARAEFPICWQEILDAHFLSISLLGPPASQATNVTVQSAGAITIGGNTLMSTTNNEQNITGGTFNAPVAVNQTFTNCFNTASAVQDVDLRQKLQDVVKTVELMYPELEAGPKGKAERRLQTLTDEAASPEPDKETVLLSGKGLIEAAETCGKMVGPVSLAVKGLLAFFGIPLP